MTFATFAVIFSSVCVYSQMTDGVNLSDFFDKQSEYSSLTYGNDKTNGLIKESTDIGLIDNSIDDLTYFVGGGDVFTVSLVGSATFYTGAINQNNDLFIPEIGIAKIGKISLADAKKVIREHYSSKLKREVYVTLSKVKNANISVRGVSFKRSGTYRFSGTTRVLDAIRIVNGDTLPSMIMQNFRDVVCINRDSIRHFDLFKYFYKGDKSQNPYIYPGDEIVLDPATKRIYLAGEVASISGTLPILPNEDICEFLDHFVFWETADSQNIIVQKTESDNSRSIKTINYKNRENYALQDRDAISVTKKKNYPNIKMIDINGEIASMGKYPIIANATKAMEIIEQAGGVTINGDISRAVILRTNKCVPSGVLESNDIRPEINSAISSMRLRKDYTVIYLKDQDIILEVNDQIYIPKIETQVYLSGNIKKPGGIPFKEGMDYKYYIKKAGGFQKRADKHNVFVITLFDNVAISKGDGEIEAGDVIVVPTSQQNKTLSTVILPVLSAVATTLGVLLAVYATVK